MNALELADRLELIHPLHNLRDLHYEAAAMLRSQAAEIGSLSSANMRLQSALESLRTELSECRMQRLTDFGEYQTATEELARMRNALGEVAEYWNRDQNEAAMADACWNAIDVANKALAPKGDV
jgi:hypothetical protein